jgi:hypothetical protein
LQDYSKPTLEQRVFDNPPERNRYTLEDSSDYFNRPLFVLTDTANRNKEVAHFFDWRVADICIRVMNNEIKLKKLRKVKKKR